MIDSELHTQPLHVFKQGVFVRLLSYSVCVIKQGMSELCIHEPSSELVKIATASCGDFDFCIYFNALFLVNICL